jgi:hypothetical protein
MELLSGSRVRFNQKTITDFGDFDKTSSLRQFLEQLQISRNHLKMAKWPLRQLSLKAVIEYRGHSAVAGRLTYLRNKKT